MSWGTVRDALDPRSKVRLWTRLMLFAVGRRLIQMAFVMFGISVLVLPDFFKTPAPIPLPASPVAMLLPRRSKPYGEASAWINPCMSSTLR